MSWARKTAVLTLWVLLCVLCMGCSRKTIIGRWQHDGYTDVQVIYEFTKNGELHITFDGEQGMECTYTVESGENRIVILHNEQEQVGVFAIDGKALTITSPDSGAVVTMTRVK